MFGFCLEPCAEAILNNGPSLSVLSVLLETDDSLSAVLERNASVYRRFTVSVAHLQFFRLSFNWGFIPEQLAKNRKWGPGLLFSLSGGHRYKP